MRSFELLNATEALTRFKIGESDVDEVVTDETTGRMFRRTIYATPIGERQVDLTVAVSPEPRIVRRARRFKLIADLIEGWRYGQEFALSSRVLEREQA